MRVLQGFSISGALGLAFLGLTMGTPVLAQSQGTLVGSVVDEITSEALEGVAVSLLGTEVRTRTDGHGVFELSSVPTGELTARVELPGYSTIVEQVEVLPDEVGLYRFRLSPMAVTLEGLVVRARGESNQGALVSQVEGGRLEGQTALDLLREQVPGLMVRNTLGSDTGIRIRGSRSLIANDPVIYLNGVLVSDLGNVSTVHVLDQISAEQVLRIRVLGGPAAAVRYGDTSSGAILVETR